MTDMKNQQIRGILALLIVTVLSFGVIAGSRALGQDLLAAQNSGSQGEGQTVTEELEAGGAEHVKRAAKTQEGYLVSVTTSGYGGDIHMDVYFQQNKETISKVEVTEQTETEGVGSRITEAEFLSQFEGAKAPVFLNGISSGTQEQEADGQEERKLSDGTYEAKTEEADSSGYTDQVTMTVKDGRITEVTWDAADEEGNKKSVLSETGVYVMTEDGPTWKEQAEALADAVVANQSLGFLSPDNQGKTDAVSGVSIAVTGFVRLAQQCLDQAAGAQTEAAGVREGTQADAVSGATISSSAAAAGINAAYEFLKTVK